MCSSDLSESLSQWTNPELLLIGANVAIVGLNSIARLKTEGAFIVTENGVILPKGANIPKHYIQNPYRKGSYGIIKDGVFHEKLRIDAATPKGKKGPNVSHIHVNGSGHHKTTWDF